MLAECSIPVASKFTWMNLPKRDELLFLWVLALPKASSRGLESSTCFSMVGYSLEFSAWAASACVGFLYSRSCSGPLKPCPARARYASTILVASVLPAPLSPVIMID